MSVEMVPYDNAAAQAGAVLVTRDMRPVQFIEFNPKLKEMVRVRAQVKGLIAPMTYFENGRRVLEKETKYDLFMLVEVAPAPKKTVKAKKVAKLTGVEATIAEYVEICAGHEAKLLKATKKQAPAVQALLDSARAVLASLQAYSSLVAAHN